MARTALTVLVPMLLLMLCCVDSRQHSRENAVARKLGFKHFEKIIVISLVKRQDRREQIAKELQSVGVQTFDILDAVETQCSPLGCTLSHMLAIQKCKDVRARTCLVLEDDFTFIQDPDSATRNVDAFFAALPSTDWDVISLASSVIAAQNTSHASFLKVINAQTTSGYAVNRHYYDEIISTYLSSAWLLNESKCDVHSKNLFAVDMFMKHKQPFGNWYVMEPRLGKQRQGFSDIEKVVTDYNV